MNGVNIGTFDSTVPADTESLGLTDDRIRSVKTTLQQVLDDEHVFAAAGGTVGQHRLGSARPYFGAQSTVSSSGTDGRLMVASDTSRLFGVGSGGTVLLGAGPGSLSIGSTPGATFPQRHYWVEEVGFGTTNADGNLGVTFPNSGFSGIPYVFASHATIGDRALPVAVAIYNLTQSGCTIACWVTSSVGSQSNAPVYWRSLGTRVL